MSEDLGQSIQETCSYTHVHNSGSLDFFHDYYDFWIILKQVKIWLKYTNLKSK